MDFLKAELAKKKAQIEERDKKLAVAGQSYVKRKDIEEYEKQRYLERCTKKRKEETQTKEKVAIVAQSCEETIPLLSENEVIKRLRDRAEPIKLFGETPGETYKRLRSLEMQEPSACKSQNDFKSAMEKIDQEYLNAMMMELHGDAIQNKPDRNLPSFEEIAENCHGIDSPDITLDKLFPMVQQFYRWMMELWDQWGEMKFKENERDLSVKLERAKIKQCEEYLKPFFRSLKKKNLEETLVRSFGEIAGAVLQRNYISANDVYLRTAIGNAAWPIGVTMVGIHARTGREKLFAHNVAHVLNDEKHRKYLQAIKRLITFAQRRFPTDPSKCVEYNA